MTWISRRNSRQLGRGNASRKHCEARRHQDRRTSRRAHALAGGRGATSDVARDAERGEGVLCLGNGSVQLRLDGCVGAALVRVALHHALVIIADLVLVCQGGSIQLADTSSISSHVAGSCQARKSQ
jgi:hypothetical protein